MAWVAILQVLLGFLLFLQGLRPKDGLHLLYGLLLAAGLHYLGGLEPGGWLDRKSTRLNSSHMSESRMPSSA